MTLPNSGANVASDTTWTSWNGTVAISAAAGMEIGIVEAASGLAVAGGKVISNAN